MKSNKQIKYTRKTLIKVLESYKRIIERDGKEYPTVIISDLSASITYVLNKCKEEDFEKAQRLHKSF